MKRILNPKGWKAILDFIVRFQLDEDRKRDETFESSPGRVGAFSEVMQEAEMADEICPKLIEAISPFTSPDTPLDQLPLPYPVVEGGKEVYSIHLKSGGPEVTIDPHVAGGYFMPVIYCNGFTLRCTDGEIPLESGIYWECESLQVPLLKEKMKISS